MKPVCGLLRLSRSYRDTSTLTFSYHAVSLNSMECVLHCIMPNTAATAQRRMDMKIYLLMLIIGTLLTAIHFTSHAAGAALENACRSRPNCAFKALSGSTDQALRANGKHSAHFPAKISLTPRHSGDPDASLSISPVGCRQVGDLAALDGPHQITRIAGDAASPCTGSTAMLPNPRVERRQHLRQAHRHARSDSVRRPDFSDVRRACVNPALQRNVASSRHARSHARLSGEARCRAAIVERRIHQHDIGAVRGRPAAAKASAATSRRYPARRPRLAKAFACALPRGKPAPAPASISTRTRSIPATRLGHGQPCGADPRAEIDHALARGRAGVAAASSIASCPAR